MIHFRAIYKNFYSSIGIAVITLILLATTFSTHVYAAYCSLRDPIIAINTLFPNSTQHRSIVRPITQAERQRISQELPFTLHFNEIGQHTLYVAQQETKAIGFVHARSELSSRGIIEVAWAMNLDMSINGFFFQRCRSPECNGILPQQLSKHLKGKTFNDLLLMLDETSTQLTPAIQLQYGTKSELVLAVIRSALKTLSVTHIAWSDDIDEIRRQSLAIKNFGAQSILKAQSLPISASRSELLSNTIITPSSIKTFVVTHNEEIVAHLVDASWQQDNLDGSFNWLFSPTGKVLDIQTSRKWPNEEVETAFKTVIGIDFSTQNECATTVEFAGKALFNFLFTET